MVPLDKSPVHDPLIGLVISNYIIREKLAEGGMGVVYLAVHEILPTKKVVKVLLGEFVNHPVIRARFEREATAAARLNHRYIIKIDNFGSLADGQLFLMMPFLDGKSLEAHLRQHRKLNIYDATHIIEQVFVALQHLHDQGIVHRDLKPGNIFITREDDNRYKVTLIDLGIARDLAVEATTFKTDTGISMGTPGYMAPEQYGDAGNATPAADIYAAGIILWEMLTGQRPWNAPNTNMLFHLQVSTIPALPPGLDMAPELLALLHKMLAKDPNLRPTNAREAGVELASLVPSISPHVPSGADILEKVAPEFRQNASPYDGTLRHRGSGDRLTPAAISWSPQGTHIPELNAGTPRPQFSVPRREGPESAPTVNQRPITPSTPIPVVQSGPPGVSTYSPPAGSGVAKIIALGVLCAVVASTTVLIVSKGRAGVSDTAKVASNATPVDAAVAMTVPRATRATTPPPDAPLPASVPFIVDAAIAVPVDAGVAPIDAGKPVVKAVLRGALAVTVTPWAEVSIDGVNYGQTPVHATNLVVGKHRVVLKNATTQKVVGAVVTAGKTTVIEETL